MRLYLTTLLNVIFYAIVLVVGAWIGNTGIGQFLVILAFVAIVVNAGIVLTEKRDDYRPPPRMGPK